MSHVTRLPRISREAYEAGLQSWRDGEPWAPEWKPWRRLAAEVAGIVDAPVGTFNDRDEDDQPSERHLIYRAMVDTPDLLDAALRAPRVRSWSSALAIVLRGRDRRLDDVIEEERHVGRGSDADPTPRQAMAVFRRLTLVADDQQRAKILAAAGAGRCWACGQELRHEPA